MQKDTKTNLKLIDPESATSISKNLQISYKITRPLNKTAGTNEVDLSALQLYIVHFSKLPNSILGALGTRFMICLQPRDQDPITYIIPFPRPFSILIPRRTFFSYYAQVRMLTLLNNCYMIFSLQILFMSSIWFLCV
jgi:hypothetical protein